MRRTGRSRSAVYEVLGGRTKGTGVPSSKYRDVAIKEATDRLQNLGSRLPRHPYGVLYRASEQAKGGVRHCAYCHRALEDGVRRDALYHPSCRSSAHRMDLS
jgi:hypothetical protein